MKKTAFDGLIFSLGGITGLIVGFGLFYFSGNSEVVFEAKLQIAFCEQTLPRDTHCVLTAVVEVE